MVNHFQLPGCLAGLGDHPEHARRRRQQREHEHKEQLALVPAERIRPKDRQGYRWLIAGWLRI